jgi:hypothetical protein
MKRRLVLACAIGFVISVLLATFEDRRHSDVWMILQLPGLLAGASIWGVHSGGYSFEAVMVIVDTIVYSFLVLLASGLVRFGYIAVIGAAVGIFWLTAIDAGVNGALFWFPNWHRWPAYLTCPFIPLVGLRDFADLLLPVLNALAYWVVARLIAGLRQRLMITGGKPAGNS